MSANRTEHRPHRHHSGRRLASWAAAALLTAACTTTSPSSPPPPGATSPVPNSSAAGDTRSAAALDMCARFITAALSSDSTTDAGPADVRRRAAQQFGTAELVGRLDGEGRDPNWPILAAHGGRVQVSTTPVTDDPATYQADQVGAAVIATRTAVADNGWRHELPSTVAYCALVTTVDGWRIADVTFSDTTTSEVPW